MTMTSQFVDMASSPNRFVVILFLYRYFMSISWLFLELWQFSFLMDWPEIRKSELPSSEFYPISGEEGQLVIPCLTQIHLIKCYWMLKNARITALPFLSHYGKTNRGIKLHPPPTHTHTHTHTHTTHTHPHRLGLNEYKIDSRSSERRCSVNFSNFFLNFKNIRFLYCRKW